MHKIVKSHLDSYVVSCGLDHLNEFERFENFCNYSVVLTGWAQRLTLPR